MSRLHVLTVANGLEQIEAIYQKLKGEEMAAVETQVDKKLTELGITTPPPKRRAIHKSRDYSELWPWYLEYRKGNPNARITAEPDEDGYFRVYARAA